MMLNVNDNKGDMESEEFNLVPSRLLRHGGHEECFSVVMEHEMCSI